jgi:hypothetical protein
MLTLRDVNADLGDSALALTEVLSGCVEELERHLAARVDEGRPAWHALHGPDGAELTALLVAEIHALVGSTLRALRTRQIVDSGRRLLAYEAIDLASRRAADAAGLLELVRGSEPAAERAVVNGGGQPAGSAARTPRSH